MPNKWVYGQGAATTGALLEITDYQKTKISVEKCILRCVEWVDDHFGLGLT